MSLQNWQTPDELPLLAVGISQQTQYRQPFVDDLAETALTLVDGGGQEVTYRFDDAHSVVRIDENATEDASYDATLVRPGIYLVDIMIDRTSFAGAAPGHPINETWALDLNTGCATLVTSFVFQRVDHVRWVRSIDAHWWLADGPRRGQHERSTGLVGKRVLWQYSDTDRYDHVYLNGQNFAWQCVSGVEEGLSELDRSRAYEVADDLYFFGWSEHVQPVESMLFIDVATMKTYGRMFGWEERTGEILHHQFGARGTLLNVTSYPPPEIDRWRSHDDEPTTQQITPATK